MTKFDDKIPASSIVLAHQAGWLRRPEMDQGEIECWEQPNGDLVAVKKGSGEPKVAIHKVPKFR